MRDRFNWINWRRPLVARRWRTSRAPILTHSWPGGWTKRKKWPEGFSGSAYHDRCRDSSFFYNAASPSSLAESFAKKCSVARLLNPVAILNYRKLCCCDFRCRACCSACSWIRYLLICLALWCVGEWEPGPVFSLSWLDPHSSIFQGVLIFAVYKGYSAFY